MEHSNDNYEDETDFLLRKARQILRQRRNVRSSAISGNDNKPEPIALIEAARVP